MAVRKKHLIGAYGLFWERALVDWNPGPGRQWQMLGAVGKNRGTLKICDFRRARGIYMLFNEYGATYVGLARGQQGFGQRLQTHTLPPKKQPKELRTRSKGLVAILLVRFRRRAPLRRSIRPVDSLGPQR